MGVAQFILSWSDMLKPYLAGYGLWGAIRPCRSDPRSERPVPAGSPGRWRYAHCPDDPYDNEPIPSASSGACQAQRRRNGDLPHGLDRTLGEVTRPVDLQSQRGSVTVKTGHP